MRPLHVPVRHGQTDVSSRELSAFESALCGIVLALACIAFPAALAVLALLVGAIDAGTFSELFR
ncbi:MAG: hypothetical protein A2580_18120 [Hydrogenophilales bacterium RIFOXYD1_FULL_62_11]|nr:MAG: hypothetical protein A2580_18120 [Hydrogenophilales bacterium RIFOXYD1_FULL_62_11]